MLSEVRSDRRRLDVRYRKHANCLSPSRNYVGTLVFSSRYEKKQSIAAAEGLPQGGGAAEGLPRGGAPSEVLTPLVRIGHQQFILHSILPAQALEECTLP